MDTTHFRDRTPGRPSHVLNRRQLLGGIAGLGAVAAAAGHVHTAEAAAVRTRARVVIVGAGAAGIAAANRLNRLLDGATITLIDARREHWYQPGFTLVATGVWPQQKLVDDNARYIPSGVNWVQSMVAEYDPDANRVVTDDGQIIDYDYLVIATGLSLDYDRIEGMSADLIGQHGIASVYASPAAAAASWQVFSEFAERGGTGLFTRPPGAIKCAGAPVKTALLNEHRLRQRGGRDRARLHYTIPATGMFSQPEIDQFLKTEFPRRGIEVEQHHRLLRIDAPRREATFATPDGERTLAYDVIHVVPTMSAPASLAASPLPWQEGEHAIGHWLEVDMYTLQHRRYPNIFGTGDINGVPMGKTAASVKAQVPVAVANLTAMIADREMTMAYDGYTSCPLITEVGRAILVEFDYEAKMVPSFPFIDPYTEHWVPWVMKDRFLQAAYNAMLRGRV